MRSRARPAMSDHRVGADRIVAVAAGRSPIGITGCGWSKARGQGGPGPERSQRSPADARGGCSQSASKGADLCTCRDDGRMFTYRARLIGVAPTSGPRRRASLIPMSQAPGSCGRAMRSRTTTENACAPTSGEPFPSRSSGSAQEAANLPRAVTSRSSGTGGSGRRGVRDTRRRVAVR